MVLFVVSATKMLSALSTATPEIKPSRAVASGPSSAPLVDRPAKVVTVAPGVILRMVQLRVSAT